MRRRAVPGIFGACLLGGWIRESGGVRCGCEGTCVQEMQNALHVEVEARECHDEVEVVVLSLDEEGEALGQEAAVVGGEANVLEAGVEAEDRRVLDVRVVV